ncbi:MAG: extracellular solute-binding protein [Aggregatilineales bacterium]
MRLIFYKRRATFLCLSALAVLLAGCGLSSNGDTDSLPTATVPAPTATALPVSQSTLAPEVDEPPLPDERTLVIWWPELLPVTDTLQSQLQDFSVTEESGIEIDFRLKRVGDLGGIMSTLRTGITIAPDAMPDVTLMRREDLIIAAGQGLIQPLEGVTSVSSSVIGGLYDIALTLGQYDDSLYGLTYILSALHGAYLPTPENDIGEATLGWSFEDVLERDMPFTFPAGRQLGVNETFLLQYLNAGGTPPDESGAMTLNTDALLTILTFYEEAAQSGIVDDTVFEFSSPSDYQSSLSSGVLTSAVVRSSQFLSLREEGEDWQLAPIPTVNGDAVSLVDGWMWVIVANTPEQQDTAVRFLNWMMDVERQRQYAESAQRLPSQILALRNMDRNLLETALMDELITNSIAVMPQTSGNALTRAMQNALISVVRGDRSAQQATQDVIDIVGVSE